jgi:hypothetical protein
MDNSVRKTYGKLPNSAYFIEKGGKIFHKEAWARPDNWGPILEDMLKAGQNDSSFRFQLQPSVHRVRKGIWDRYEIMTFLLEYNLLYILNASKSPHRCARRPSSHHLPRNRTPKYLLG